MLAKSKVNSIESLISKALKDMKISHDNLRSKNENKKTKDHKIEQHKIKKINAIKKIFFFLLVYSYKNVRDNKKKLL